MPAAASFEDIYKTSSSSSSSSSSPTAAPYHHLPDYMAMYSDDLLSTSCPDTDHLGSQLKLQTTTTTTPVAAQHQHPLKANRVNQAARQQLKTYQQPQQQVATNDGSISQIGQLTRRQLYGRRHSNHNEGLAQELHDYRSYYGLEARENSDLGVDDELRDRSWTRNKFNALYNLNSMITYDDDDDVNHTADYLDDDQDQQPFYCLNNPSTTNSSFLASTITMTPPTHQHYLTLEELKMAHSSCWLCGCNWQQDHVSLDCQECGGYALTRPCPNCDGKCKQVWERNITGTHDHHKALWLGQCKLQKGSTTSPSAGTPLGAISIVASIAEEKMEHTTTTTTTTSTTTTTGTTMTSSGGVGGVASGPRESHKPSLASSCCSSQPSSAASSDSESECANSMCKVNPQLFR